MPESVIYVKAVGSSPVVTVPALEFDPALQSAKYLRIALQSNPSKSGIFEVNPVPRGGASGGEIYVLPGQLGLDYDKREAVLASPATRWSYRRSQLRTTNGFLLLGTLASALISASIDGSLAVGKIGVSWFILDAATIDVLTAFSMLCKIVTAVLAFLLALWFKK
jgi:hypothetical protein